MPCRIDPVIEDARDLEPNTVLESDIAIIGGGAAGITLALELAGKGLQTCLLESGGLDYAEDTQSLYSGANAARWYFPLDKCRLRYFGGSTNHWGGWCRPLAPIDFEARDWVPHSGWPLSRADLDPWYERAQPLIEAGPFQYESAAYWEARFGQPMPAFPLGLITTNFFQYSPPTRFGSRYRDALRAAGDVRIVLHANVLEIEASEAATEVTGLRVTTLAGNPFRVRARSYVLATGGIENARLLLASRSTRPDGLGNDHDLVGRYFMEHPHIPLAAHIACNRPSALPALFTRHLIDQGTTAHATLVPTEQLLRSERLQGAAFTVGVMAEYRQDTAVPADEWHTGDVFQVLQDLDPASGDAAAAGGGIEGWPPPDAAGTHLVLGGACEQAPDPESRVVLGSERDALGMPRAQLNWRLGQGDRDSLYRVLHSIGREFGALGIGRLRPFIGPDEDWPAEVLGGNHHMGTTRMARDPKQGVVDADCKVHGIANLYIAGSSVFPTGGSANPTLTLVALALRLAHHLQARLA
jgi:choline dehydrogenase-like flavoprotein